ncbi:MAG: IS21 family transposase [Acidobacteriota bacterium]|nr:IS21 family transposase [Acidobacteriota bacterium]
MLRGGIRTQKRRRETPDKDLELIRQLFQDCKGNVTRVQEIMEQKYARPIAYSTLTKMVREAHLRPSKPRAGRYAFGPGVEMQHDTSPHRVRIGEKTVTAQCAGLVLAYSRRAFVQYYPRFTRFETKCYLSEAVAFMSGVCSRCVIDNTCVVLASGSGADAMIAPEMEAFGRCYGFEFFAHSIGNPNRKPLVERLFHFAENNFLPGRTFKSWPDLNEQAARWCREVANAREKRSLGMSPQAAWLMEKSFLHPLPDVPPPVYKTFSRIVDNSGFINLETNRYSVPERLVGKRLEVHKYLERVRIYHGGRRVADHPRLIDQRDGRITAPGHHPPLFRKAEETACEQEQKLTAHHPDLDAYISGLKQRVRGRGMAQFRRLLNLKRTYPHEAFLAAVQHALHYCLYDLNRLENMILERVAGDFFQLEDDGAWPCD